MAKLFENLSVKQPKPTHIFYATGFHVDFIPPYPELFLAGEPVDLSCCKTSDLCQNERHALLGKGGDDSEF